MWNKSSGGTPGPMSYWTKTMRPALNDDAPAAGARTVGRVVVGVGVDVEELRAVAVHDRERLEGVPERDVLPGLGRERKQAWTWNVSFNAN